MSKAKAFSDHLDWFYTHCAMHHDNLKTKKRMIDMALWAMCQVKSHFLVTEVTRAVKEDFAKMLSNQNKCVGRIFFCHAFTDPICNCLFDLKDDHGFTKKELYRQHNHAERALLGGGN
jgi:hypothetical protein